MSNRINGIRISDHYCNEKEREDARECNLNACAIWTVVEETPVSKLEQKKSTN